MTDQARRPLPAGGVSTPHIQAFHGARHLLDILERQTAWVHIRASEIDDSSETLVTIAAEDALERQALSEAVQVFATLTVEGMMNVLGVLVFGEEAFTRKFKRTPLVDKIKKLIPLIDGKSDSTLAELVKVAKRLTGARNAFVHPKPQEGSPRFDETPRKSDLQGARAAMEDLRHFFALLRELNSDYRIFFNLF